MKILLVGVLFFSIFACGDNKNTTTQEEKIIVENIEKIADNIDTTPYDNMSSEEKNEALIEASERGDLGRRDLETVKALIKSGADINFQREGSAYTALMVASDKGHIEIVKYLVEKGADLNLQDNYDGNTALMKASYSSSYITGNKYLEVVKYLVEKGADINIQTEYGRTALVNSMQHGGESPEVVKFLIDNGADITPIFGYRYDYSDNTAWEELIEYESTEIIKYLVENGVDTNNMTTQ